MRVMCVMTDKIEYDKGNLEEIMLTPKEFAEARNNPSLTQEQLAQKMGMTVDELLDLQQRYQEELGPEPSAEDIQALVERLKLMPKLLPAAN